MAAKLSREFYTRADVVRISRELIGKHLFTRMNGKVTGGIIVETEAYAGPTDRASHAYNGRRTRRNEPMYGTGGTAYVYLCYGIHHLFNISTNASDVPHAVLVRAIEPTHGIPCMLRRRGLKQVVPRLTAGPGALTQALAINTRHTSLDLLGNRIWLEDRHRPVQRKAIVASARVGIGYAGPDRDNPWRFRLRTSGWTSPAK